MTHLELIELMDLHKLRESAAMAYTRAVLQQYPYDIHYEPDQYLFAVPKGAPDAPCLVAHIDTVRSEADHPVELMLTDDILFNAAGVLGADDRAGVAILLQLVRRLEDLPYLLITHGEERGCIGAKAFSKTKVLEQHMEHIQAFIEYDRRGFNEMVTYHARVPSGFTDLFSLVGYEKKAGSVSDVRVLTEATDIAHVNLSAGYINQHRTKELLFFKAVDFAVSSACTVLPLIDTQWLLTPPPPPAKAKPKEYPPREGDRFRWGYPEYEDYDWDEDDDHYGYGQNTSNYIKYKCGCCEQFHDHTVWYPEVKTRLCSKCIAEVIARSKTHQVTPVALYQAIRELGSEESPEEESNSPTTPIQNTQKLGEFCPRCGSVDLTKKTVEHRICKDCKHTFYLVNGENIWYTYSKTAGEYALRRHIQQVIDTPAGTIPDNCPHCAKKRRVYQVKPKSANNWQWKCFSCARKLVDTGELKINDLKEALRIRRLIPF